MNDGQNCSNGAVIILPHSEYTSTMQGLPCDLEMFHSGLCWVRCTHSNGAPRRSSSIKFQWKKNKHLLPHAAMHVVRLIMCRSSEGLEVFSLSERLSMLSSCISFFNSNNLLSLISPDAFIIPNLMMAKGKFGKFEERINCWDADPRDTRICRNIGDVLGGNGVLDGMEHTYPCE